MLQETAKVETPVLKTPIAKTLLTVTKYYHWKPHPLMFYKFNQHQLFNQQLNS